MGWCHWGRCHCLVAALDHDGDLRGVEVVLVARLRDPLSGMEVIEAKFSHLAALRERLTAAGFGPADRAPARALKRCGVRASQLVMLIAWRRS